MATRATYKFENETHGGSDATVYVHYGPGASEKFLRMLEVEGAIHDGLGTRFIKANKRAELCDEHESHVDTRYRYTLTQTGHLAVKKRETNPNGSGFFDDFWNVVWKGTLEDFLREFGTDEQQERVDRIFSEVDLEARNGERLGDVLPVQPDEESEAVAV